MVADVLIDILNGRRTRNASMSGCPIFSEDEMKTIYRYSTGMDSSDESYERWLTENVIKGWADILHPSIATVAILFDYGRDADAVLMLRELHTDGTLQKQIDILKKAINEPARESLMRDSSNAKLVPKLDEGYLG